MPFRSSRTAQPAHARMTTRPTAGRLMRPEATGSMARTRAGRRIRVSKGIL